MNDKERIEKAIARIEKDSVLDKRTTTEEIYHKMLSCTLSELAIVFTKFQNLIYDLRDILEGRNED